MKKTNFVLSLIISAAFISCSSPKEAIRHRLTDIFNAVITSHSDCRHLANFLIYQGPDTNRYLRDTYSVTDSAEKAYVFGVCENMQKSLNSAESIMDHDFISSKWRDQTVYTSVMWAVNNKVITPHEFEFIKVGSVYYLKSFK